MQADVGGLLLDDTDHGQGHAYPTEMEIPADVAPRPLTPAQKRAAHARAGVRKRPASIADPEAMPMKRPAREISCLDALLSVPKYVRELVTTPFRERKKAK